MIFTSKLMYKTHTYDKSILSTLKRVLANMYVLPNRLSATVLNTFMCLYCVKKLRKIQTEIDRVLYPDKLSVMLSVTLEPWSTLI